MTNNLYDFSIRELNLIGMAILLLASQVDGDESAPTEMLPLLETIYGKFREVMESRCAEEAQFNSITKQLPDLLQIANDLIKEMDNNK